MLYGLKKAKEKREKKLMSIKNEAGLVFAKSSNTSSSGSGSSGKTKRNNNDIGLDPISNKNMKNGTFYLSKKRLPKKLIS